MASDTAPRGLTRKGFLHSLLGAAAGGAMLAGSGAFMAASAADRVKSPNAKSGAAAKGTRLILLGTAGGPDIRKFRSQPSSLLVVDGTPYMIDAGAGTMRQLAWAGYRTNDVEAIFITHNHLDHNADVGTIISFDWIQARKRKLPIYGPYGTEHIVHAALDYFSVSERIFGAEAKFNRPASSFVEPHNILKNGLVFQDSRIKVTAAENSHYHTFHAGKDKSFSYRFDTADRSVVFSGDTGPTDALTELAKGADMLVSEVIDVEPTVALVAKDFHLDERSQENLANHMRYEHMPPEDLGKIAAKAGVKMVVLTHIVPGLDNETNASRYTAGVRRYYNGPVIAGRDLLEL